MARTSDVRAARVVFFAGLVAGTCALSMGCGRSDTERSDSAASRTSADSSKRPVTNYKGTLEHPIEWYEKNPQRFVEFVNRFRWGWGHAHNRQCSPPQCRPGMTTKVEIDAIEDGHLIDFTQLPDSGVLVARMKNVGNYHEALYKIPPGADWYFLWGGDGSSTPHVRLVKVDRRGGLSVKVDAISKLLGDCGDGHKQDRPEADFRNCARDTTGISTENDPQRLLAMPRAWVACSQGCCTSEYPFLP